MLLALVHAAALLLPAPVAALPAAEAVAARAPELWLSFPRAGELADPVVLVGTNFGDAPIPFFGLIPSLPVRTWNSPNIPGIGSLSLMLTAVPPTFFPGRVDLTVVSNFQRSNAVPFTIR